ncbi:MAG TPA: P-loop NTPase fold protein [Polyangiaceae bacterium]|nr:P-loop NTPase fold protein [Polyangiaceae bacterium]
MGLLTTSKLVPPRWLHAARWQEEGYPSPMTQGNDEEGNSRSPETKGESGRVPSPLATPTGAPAELNGFGASVTSGSLGQGAINMPPDKSSVMRAQVLPAPGEEGNMTANLEFGISTAGALAGAVEPTPEQVSKREENAVHSHKSATRAATESGTTEQGTQAHIRAVAGAPTASAATTLDEPSSGFSARTYAHNDVACSTDLIGFRPYVEATAEFLLNDRTEPPLVLSVEGAWGSGKSSFMLQLQTALERQGERPAKGNAENSFTSKLRSQCARQKHWWAKFFGFSRQPVRVVKFNAWRNDKDEALWSSFALNFQRQISPKRVRRLWCWGRLWWSRLDLEAASITALAYILFVTVVTLAFGVIVVQQLLFPELQSSGASDSHSNWYEFVKTWPSVALASPPALFLAGVLRKYAPTIAKLNINQHVRDPKYGTRLGFAEAFHEDFERICNVYIDSTEKVFVFIEDLDRAEVPRAAELIQALTVMIPDNSRLVFVLAIDRDRVAAGIAAKHEKLLPFLARPANRPDGETQRGERTDFEPREVALAFGHQFLEKVVQLPMRLPTPGSSALEPLLAALLGVAAPSASTGDVSQAPVREPLDEDPPGMRDLLLMIAPTLEFNPRRLKQFLNLFRLRYYVSVKTGRMQGLTLGRLAKVVAVELRWPEWLHDLARSTDISEVSKRDYELKGLLELGNDRDGKEYTLHPSDFLVSAPR